MENKKDLYEYKLNGKERESKLDYADFDSLVNKAKSMDKKDLENYYIDKNNKKQTPDWALIVFSFVIVGIIMLIMYTGMSVANNETLVNVNDIESDICEYLPEDYISEPLVDKRWFNKNTLEEYTLNCKDLK